MFNRGGDFLRARRRDASNVAEDDGRCPDVLYGSYLVVDDSSTFALLMSEDASLFLIESESLSPPSLDFEHWIGWAEPRVTLDRRDVSFHDEELAGPGFGGIQCKPLASGGVPGQSSSKPDWSNLSVLAFSETVRTSASSKPLAFVASISILTTRLVSD